jgi:signal transduction histidine kinase
MPKIHGLELLKRLKRIDKDNAVPVMVLTAEHNRVAKLDALNLGAKDFITKPFDITEVTARIHNLIETRFAYRNLNHKNKTLDLIVQARAKMLHKKHLQLENLNKDLESRVEQRTKELNDANYQLRKTNDAMFDLVSVVSHEFRTPLTSIKGFAEILREDNESLDDESRNQFLLIINNEADRLNRLVTNLLDLQKIDAGKMDWKQDNVNLTAVITESVALSELGYREKNVSLTFTPEIDLAPISGDQDKLQQVIINLLSNALKFTNQGEVKIDIAKTTHWANIALLSNSQRTAEVCGEIADSINANLIIHTDSLKFKNFISINGRNTAMALIEMDIEGTALETIEYIRERYHDLPVTPLYTEAQTSPGLQPDSHKWKPLRLGNDNDKIALLIRDAACSDPMHPMYKVTIKDTGIGIPEDQLVDIFTRFHQVNQSETREQRGTGLGLSICEEIVKHHNGVIWIESNLDLGSTVTLLLPKHIADKKYLGTILIEKGIATEDQIIEALRDQNQ